MKLNITGLLSKEFRDFMGLIESVNETEGFESAFRLQRGYIFELVSNLASKWKNIFKESKEIRKEDFDMPLAGNVSVCMPNATKIVLDRFGSGICRKVDVGGYSFLFTPVSKSSSDNSYLECLFFVLTPDGFCYPRLAYKSRSGVRWKVSSYLGTYGKGFSSYASETIPIDEVDSVLNELESSLDCSRIISMNFDFSGDDAREIETYDREDVVKRLPLPGFYHLSDIDPNLALAHREDVDRFFGQNSVPNDFIPDFSKDPATVYVRMDGVRIEKYEHNYRGIQLHFDMASDIKGRVWVDHIQEVGGEITSFGTRKSVLLCGPFSVKPHQYDKDITGLNPAESVVVTKQYSFDDGINIERTLVIEHDDTRPVDMVPSDIGYGYLDITPLFDRLPLIQAYRKARGIWRKVD